MFPAAILKFRTERNCWNGMSHSLWFSIQRWIRYLGLFMFTRSDALPGRHSFPSTKLTWSHLISQKNLRFSVGFLFGKIKWHLFPNYLSKTKEILKGDFWSTSYGNLFIFLFATVRHTIESESRISKDKVHDRRFLISKTGIVHSLIRSFSQLFCIIVMCLIWTWLLIWNIKETCYFFPEKQAIMYFVSVCILQIKVAKV